MRKLLPADEAAAIGAAHAGAALVAAYSEGAAPAFESILRHFTEMKAFNCLSAGNAIETAFGAALSGTGAFALIEGADSASCSSLQDVSGYAEMNAGFVIIAVESDERRLDFPLFDKKSLAKAADIPTFEAADSQEAFDFTKQAFDISERFNTPVLIIIRRRTARTRSVVEVPNKKYKAKAAAKFKKSGAKNSTSKKTTEQRRADFERRQHELKLFAEEMEENRTEKGSKSLGVICAGEDYLFVKEALADAKLLKLAMINPLPEKKIKKFARSVDKLYVIESAASSLEMSVRALGLEPQKRRHPHLAELNAGIILSSYAKGKKKKKTEEPDRLPVRLPKSCEGCLRGSIIKVLSETDLPVHGDTSLCPISGLAPSGSMNSGLFRGAKPAMSSGFDIAAGFSKNARASLGLMSEAAFYEYGVAAVIDALNNEIGLTLIIFAGGLGGSEKDEAHADIEALCRACGVKRTLRLSADEAKAAKLKGVVEKEVSTAELSVIVIDARCDYYTKGFVKRRERKG